MSMVNDDDVSGPVTADRVQAGLGTGCLDSNGEDQPEYRNKTLGAGQTNQSGSIPNNTTTKADLLSRAKDAIEAGDQSLHEAAEVLALARDNFKASQREIADAVGKSTAWVNRLLRWQGQGCIGTPFGPGSKAGRERQKRVQSTEQRAPRKVDSDSPEASTEVCTPEGGEPEAAPRSQTQTKLLGEFKFAVNKWLLPMDNDTRREAVEYAIAKSGVAVSCASDK